MATSVKAIFKYGDNALDMVAESPKPYIVTGILPRGTDSSGDYVSECNRQYHKDSLTKYGQVVEIVDFGKVTKKNYNNQHGDSLSEFVTYVNTLVNNKAKKWLNSRCKDYGDKITIKGIDPFYEGLNSSPIAVGNMIKAYSKPHGINETAPCLAMEIDYFNHQNDQYIIGPYIPNNFYDPKITMR